MEKEFWMTMDDQVKVYVKKWYSNIKPKAIVQVAHGMAEHIHRYHDFATYLANNGIFVYGNDHRGHGRTGDEQGLLGYFSHRDGFRKTTNDLYEITKLINEEYPNTPLYLFGHSMGSFLARKYIQTYSDAIDGVILSGTGYFPPVKTFAGKMLASVLPPKKESRLMNNIAFGSYNKKIPNHKGGFEWLSQDVDVVQKYTDDPHAGFVPTARFFYDLMDGLGDIHHKKLNASIRKTLPMLIISGDADPVGDYSKGVWKTAHHYESIGLEHITTVLFAGCRHELLNELNKEEAYTAIFNWLIANL